MKGCALPVLDSIIFDMDGLLIDTEIISYQLYSALLAPYGFTVSLHDYAETYSGKTEEKNVTTLLEHYPLPLSREECFARISAMEKEFLAKGVALKPGAKELLTYLKEHGYKIALASSSIADRAYGILDQHGIRGCFDAFVFGPDLPKGRGKPAPDIFLIACQKLDTTPARALVLEDSEAGIQAAHSARIPVLCVPDLHHPAPAYESMTAAILSSLHEVPGWLEAQNAQ